MKKHRLISTMQLLSLIPSLLYPVNVRNQNEPSTDTEEMETITLKQRLQKIKMKDKRKMTHGQRRNFQREIKAIMDRLQKISGGLYLSIGTVILFVVLLLSRIAEKFF